MTFYDICERKNGPRLFRYSSLGLLASTFLFFFTIAVCYPFSEYFTLAGQLAGHLLMLASGVSIKITYLLRCIAQKSLNQEVG